MHDIFTCDWVGKGGGGCSALSLLQSVIVGCSRVGFGFGAIQIFDITYIIKIAETPIIIFDVDDDDDEKGESRSGAFFVFNNTSSRWQKKHWCWRPNQLPLA